MTNVIAAAFPLVHEQLGPEDLCCSGSARNSRTLRVLSPRGSEVEQFYLICRNDWLSSQTETREMISFHIRTFVNEYLSAVYTLQRLPRKFK